MKHLVTKLLALTLALSLALAPCALAAGEEERVQLPAAWAVEELADSYALGLVDNEYTTYIEDPVSDEALATMCAVVSGKLALLGRAAAEASEDGLVVDTTRGGVMNALYQAASDWEFGVEADDAVGYLTALGVVHGNEGGDLMLDRVCSYQEAMVMANRLVLALYDRCGAGAKGLLWKATNGDVTLYLLGTIHVDRDNVYPFHKTLRDVILSAEKVYFELDFNDQEGLAQFALMQIYTDGTTLKDHIDADLYDRTVALFAQLGMTEEQTAAYKPWVLTQTLSNLTAQDDSTANAMAVDSYVNAKAVNHGTPVAGVETYALQGGIFDGLSMDYQIQNLDAMITVMEGVLSGDEMDPEIDQALEAQEQQFTAMMSAWKTGDWQALARTYDKESIVNSTDELSSKLFTGRDPGMVAAAKAILEEEGAHTYLMAVGAGHMLTPGGIVPELRAMGYTVDEVWDLSA